MKWNSSADNTFSTHFRFQLTWADSFLTRLIFIVLITQSFQCDKIIVVESIEIPPKKNYFETKQSIVSIVNHRKRRRKNRRLTWSSEMSKHCAILTYNSFTELNPVIKPVGEPFANWQWKTRLGGGRFCLIGDVIIWVGCCCCWWVGWWCKSLPLKLTPLVGEFDFVFLWNNGMMLLMWCIFQLDADRAKNFFHRL